MISIELDMIGRRFISILSATTLITGCSQIEDMRNPQTSPLVIDGASIPEVARVSIPMPEVQPVVFPQRAESSGLWNKSTRSFFGDNRAQEVGDILTVIIDIEDEADLSNQQKEAVVPVRTQVALVFLATAEK